MRVPSAQQRQRKVFQVAVIGRGADESAAGLERLETAARVIPWRVKMLDHLGAHHDVERGFAKVLEQFVVGRQHLEAALWVGLSRDFDAQPAQINAHRLVAAFEELPAGKAVATSDVKYARARSEVC